jgi:hypothetical protein
MLELDQAPDFHFCALCQQVNSRSQSKGSEAASRILLFSSSHNSRSQPSLSVFFSRPTWPAKLPTPAAAVPSQYAQKPRRGLNSKSNETRVIQKKIRDLSQRDNLTLHAGRLVCVA